MSVKLAAVWFQVGDWDGSMYLVAEQCCRAPSPPRVVHPLLPLGCEERFPKCEVLGSVPEVSGGEKVTTHRGEGAHVHV